MKITGSGEISSGAAYRNRTDDLRITRRTSGVHRRPVSHNRPARAASRSEHVQADPGSLLADALAMPALDQSALAAPRRVGPQGRTPVACAAGDVLPDRPGALYGPAQATLCLQNTPRLSASVAHLGSQPQRVRQDRPASVPVVVSLGGQQSPTWPLRPELQVVLGGLVIGQLRISNAC
jgi:hypothetical protein